MSHIFFSFLVFLLHQVDFWRFDRRVCFECNHCTYFPLNSVYAIRSWLHVHFEDGKDGPADKAYYYGYSGYGYGDPLSTPVAGIDPTGPGVVNPLAEGCSLQCLHCLLAI
uniref:Uncharacterized protein n=1 Tax=Ditylenchus dipsaci TaxID=166011 RepID=A0A915ETH2_9BILA